MKMGLSKTSSVIAFLSLLVNPIIAASSWSFNDASVTVQSKGSGVGAGLKEKYAGIFGLLGHVAAVQKANGRCYIGSPHRIPCPNLCLSNRRIL